MSNDSGQSTAAIQIKVVRELRTELAALACLTAFYGIEMAKSLNWTTAQRYAASCQAEAMVKTGHSRMYMATIEGNLPIGMILTTRTSDRGIRRLDALWVAEQYRGRGVARRLFQEACRGGADFHSFATPNAVAWHFANGFHPLGEREDEGTIEMFTGSYHPEYTVSVAVPSFTEMDMATIRDLEQFERERDPMDEPQPKN
ncbi:GNAT family N-acetyltransferase [Burkholderia cenocepacia]|uniref:GNAT family N-acetyltransferase n=1 Tax=Burkholderia cenocepacia TaxID=95486 RepID=UPI00396B34E3